VLQTDPKNITALKASLIFTCREEVELAKDTTRRRPTPTPTIRALLFGAVDRLDAEYQPRQEARAQLGMKPDDSLPAKDKKVCAEVKEKNSANVSRRHRQSEQGSAIAAGL